MKKSLFKAPKVNALPSFMVISFMMLGILFQIMTKFRNVKGGGNIQTDGFLFEQGGDYFLHGRDLGTETCPVQYCQGNFSGCICTQVEAPKAVGWVVLDWAIIVILLLHSMLFSGLTLGLMSLDLIGLEIVIGGDPDSEDAKYARRIQPVRAKGNLLLCTLLLGNVSVNSAMSILLEAYIGGLASFIASTLLIVIIGEILPQASCSRYPLWVGGHTIPIVKFYMLIFLPISWPISIALDCILKEEIGSIYNSNELSKLVEIHMKHKMVDEDQAKMMGGALGYKTKTVAEVMTPADKMFMLKTTDVLHFETLASIFRAGFSRIPVYEGDDRNNIVGLLFTKDLIMVDPEDNTTVKSVIQFFGRPLHSLWPETKLSEALNLFRSGKTHLALVRNVNNSDPEKDPFYEIVGLITLEDIIEEIIQEEIYDEGDLAEQYNTNRQKKDGNDIGTTITGEVFDRTTFDFARLRLLNSKQLTNSLSVDEANAVAAHISANIPSIASAIKNDQINYSQIVELVKVIPVLELKYKEKLYVKGKPITHCTLVLSGKLDIYSGNEGFRSSVGPWSLVGQSALNLTQEDGPLCDFTGTVSSEDGLRCIRISRFNVESLISNKRSSVSSTESKVKTMNSIKQETPNENLPGAVSIVIKPTPTQNKPQTPPK